MLQNLSKILSGYIKNPIIQLFLILFSINFIEYLIFVFEIGGYGVRTSICLVKCLGDISFIFILFWLLPKSKYWVMLIIQSLLTIFFITNSIYFKFWHELLPPLSYKLSGNVNNILISSAFGLINLYEIIFIVCLLFSIIIYILYFKKKIALSSKLTWNFKILNIISCLIIFIISQIAFITTQYRQDRDFLGDRFNRDFRWYLKDRFIHHDSIVNTTFLKNYGLNLYFIECVKIIAKDIASNGGKIELSEDEIGNIGNYIDSISAANNINQYPEFNDNLNKNVILIIVESLNSYVIDKQVNGHELTPVMNRLIKKEGTISSLNMKSQVADGCSSDGQLIINTGLLPIDTGVTSILFGKVNELPTLAKRLQSHNPIAIFGDDGTTWEQTANYRNYGFKDIYTLLDFKDRADEIGKDAAMFEFGVNLLSHLKSPFFLELITISTHVPFKEKPIGIQQWLAEDSSLDINERNYYNTINYFDSELGKFIESLKNKNLLDNTILFLISDHCESYSLNKEYNPNGESNVTSLPIVFIAANTGYTKKISTPTAQVNVYPTILKILNTPHQKYTGLEINLLDLRNKNSKSSDAYIDYDSIRSLSNKILRGNYFEITTKQIANLTY